MAALTEEATEMTKIQTPDKDPEHSQQEETTGTDTTLSSDNDPERSQQEETTATDSQSSDPAAKSTTENAEEKKEETQEEPPPLTYVDFLPQCFGSRMEGTEPVYAAFQTVVEQANQWLSTMPEFSAVKCETVDYKLNPSDFSQDPDQCLQHFSCNGKNLYLKGLRLWLMPRTDQSLPIQQLGYITVLPDHSSGNLMTSLSSIYGAAMRIYPDQLFLEFDTMSVTMEKLNHHLQQKPLPGRILTVETLCLKAVESDNTGKFDTENTLWTEIGKASRLFLFATRIFYVVGPPAFEKLCHHDQVPDIAQNPEDFGLRIKFAPFSRTVAQAAVWLTGQKNMRAVNFQSVTLKLERPGGAGPYKINPGAAGFTESQGLQESRYVKILRIFYVKDQTADAPALYKSTHLTTRLFVPTRTAGTKAFETFSKNMQRIITWLKATGTPVLGMETVRYMVNPEGELGINSERVDCVVSAFIGQYSLTCVRLYFPCQFQEPPPEVVPETQEDTWGWGCVLS